MEFSPNRLEYLPRCHIPRSSKCHFRGRSPASDESSVECDTVSTVTFCSVAFCNVAFGNFQVQMLFIKYAILGQLVRHVSESALGQTWRIPPPAKN